MWMQLMQQRVQKSRRTTLPLRSFLSDSGPAVLSQARPGSNSGAATRLRSSARGSSFFSSAFLASAFSGAFFSSAVEVGPPSIISPKRPSPQPTANPASSTHGNRGLRAGAGGAGGADELIGRASGTGNRFGDHVSRRGRPGERQTPRR